MIDSYTEGYLEKPEFDSRIIRQRQHITALDDQVRHLADAEALQRELRLLIGRLEDFAAQVENGPPVQASSSTRFRRSSLIWIN